MPSNNPPPLRIVSPTSTTTTATATTALKLKPTLHLLPTQLTQAREANTQEYFIPRMNSTAPSTSIPSSIEQDEKQQGQNEEGKEEQVKNEKQKQKQEEYQTVNFRGRLLKTWSSPVKIPERFIGAVVAKDSSSTQGGVRTGWEEGGDEYYEGSKDKENEMGSMLKLTEFEEVFVWGHEVVPGLGLSGEKEGKDGGEQDGVVRGVVEWLGWSSKIHDFENEDDEEGDEEKDEDMEIDSGDKNKGVDNDGDVNMDIDTPANVTTTTRVTTTTTTVSITSTTLVVGAGKEEEKEVVAVAEPGSSEAALVVVEGEKEKEEKGKELMV